MGGVQCVCRLVRDSAPHINTVVVIGCTLLLATCFLLSIDTNNPPIDRDTSHRPDEEISTSILEQRDSRYGIICIVSISLLVY